MRGKKRTREEQNELFEVLEGYLSMGFSLKKACRLAELPYSTMRDIAASYEPLRAKTAALQNVVNVQARANLIKSIREGNIRDSKWWLERYDYTEPVELPLMGGKEEGEVSYAEMNAENLRN